MQTLLLYVAVATLAVAAIAEALIVHRPLASRGTNRGTAKNNLSEQWTNVVHAKAGVLRSSPDDEDEPTTTDEASNETSPEESVLEKINNFLDTPILDANNRSDQGALAETLKEFVRDEPEIAQVTFSVVVVAIMVVLTRIITSF